MNHKPYFNIKRIKRNPHRKRLTSGFLADAESSINWLSKIVIALFFPPVVAVTTIFAKNSFIIFANVALAIGYLINFTYRSIFRLTSIIELCLSIILISIAIICAVYLTGNFIPVSWTFAGILFSANIIATAINSVFLIKNVIIPPLKKGVEAFLELFGIKLNTKLFIRPPLTLENDREILDRLLLKHYKHDTYDANISDDILNNRVKIFNNILNRLVYYINKYNESFLGNVMNQADIQRLEKIINELTLDGVADNALKFLVEKKLELKNSKLRKIDSIRMELEATYKEGSLSKFNTCLHTYFNNVSSVKNSEELEAKNTNCIKLMHSYKKYQEKKVAVLQKCRP